jgi:hypothetical protein
MERITSHAYVPAIERAFQLIPEGLHRWLGCEFLVGADPVFVGLHRFVGASYGRGYDETAHVAYPEHQLDTIPKSRRIQTVVIPTLENSTPDTLVHELGHVFHWNLDHCETETTPVSWYAETNSMESFAEAFTAWVIPGYAEKQDRDLNGLLEHLATR